jgi:hypothetical protein
MEKNLNGEICFPVIIIIIIMNPAERATTTTVMKKDPTKNQHTNEYDTMNSNMYHLSTFNVNTG